MQAQHVSRRYNAYYCVVWEHQYDGHHRRNEAYAVSMKMYLGYQNAQMGMFPCGVSIAVFKLPPTLGSTMVRKVVRIKRHTSHATRVYAGESHCQTKSERGGGLTRVGMAAVDTICPHPPFHNPNAFPEFTECTSSPLKKDSIRIDSHNSGVAWPVDIWPILNPHSPATQTRKGSENETNGAEDSSQQARKKCILGKGN